MKFSGLYLDSNALIYALEGSDELLRLAFKQFFKSVDSFDLYTSELTLAEILVDPHRRGDDVLIQRYRNLFTTSANGFIKVVPISTEILQGAASFRGRQIRFFERKPGLLDSIHASTAYWTGCSHFMTSDERLRLWDQIGMVSASAAGIDAFLASLAP